jgi:uncharacterized protein
MNTTQTPSTAPTALTQEDRNWGTIGHLSALAAFVAPFLGAVLGPLIVWLVKRDHSAFAGDCAKEALNFNITVCIGYAICALFAFVFIGIPLMLALFVVWLILTVVAAVRASEGISYRYPVSIRFIR